ncbi:MAG: hypothetical protein JXR07_07105 [Reichenbachiella sp.]
MKNHYSTLGFLLLVLLLASCGRSFKKIPIDTIIKEIPKDQVFSIVLNDMNVEGTFTNTYKHEYVVITEEQPGQPEEQNYGWFEVSESYFEMHVNDMGMELASRGEDGKLSKGVNPPGYNNYIGNEKYGQWENRGGHSFWAFYGQYAFMNSMFNMMTYPVRRSYYNDYRRGYYGTGRGYYGPMTGGRSYYGTNSSYTQSSRPRSSWSRNNSSFKQRVAGRTSRSGSRYSGSTSRSRGGGFGK